MPYTFEDSSEARLYSVLSDIILTGGVFGFENGGVGMVNLRNEMSKSGKSGTGASVKAFLNGFSPAFLI